MRVDTNLNDVKEYIEPGWYPVRITDGDLRTTKDGESQYVAWELEVFDSEDPEANDEKLWLNTSLKASALGMLKRFLETAAVDGEPIGWNEDGSFNTEDAMGAILEVQVEVTEWQGRPQNNVRNWRTY